MEYQSISITIKGKKRITLAAMAALFAVSLLCSCAGGKTTGQETVSQSQTTAAVSDEKISDGAEKNDKTETSETKATKVPSQTANENIVLNVGADTVFGGIEVETDENGELVGTEQEDTLWYKITDKRFGTYRKLSRFTKEHMKTAKANEFLKEANVCFITKNDGLYFVVGAGGKSIESSKRYVLDGGSRIRVTSDHTPACVKKYGITRSTVEFVKSEGTWKLSALMRD